MRVVGLRWTCVGGCKAGEAQSRRLAGRLGEQGDGGQKLHGLRRAVELHEGIDRAAAREKDFWDRHRH